jgi:hypothetical protein
VTIVRAGQAPRRDPRGALEALLLRSLPAAPRAALVVGDPTGALARRLCRGPPRGPLVPRSPGVESAQAGFDLVVLGADWCAASDDPLALLRRLHARAADGATLVAAVENRATAAMVQRWLEADLSDDAEGPLARAPPAPRLARVLLQAAARRGLAARRGRSDGPRRRSIRRSPPPRSRSPAASAFPPRPRRGSSAPGCSP